MTRIFSAILAMGLLTIYSCKKSSDPGGSWSFEGVTYDVTGCSTAYYTLNASNVNNNNPYSYGAIGINFHSALPGSSGVYTVVKNPPAANQVSVQMIIYGPLGQVSYMSTGGNGAEAVNVSVAKNGFLTVSGSGIEMWDGSTDSSALYLNITQTQ